MKFLSALISAAVLVLSQTVMADGHVEDAKKYVDAADWEKMKTVTVKLDEFEYSEDKLVFEAGQPYKLEMKNVGEEKHYFTAPEFFKAIATRKVQSNKDGEVKAPYFLALEMMADGGQLDLYFVPVRKGTYPVYCTIDDHRDEGMEGKIIIQ